MAFAGDPHCPLRLLVSAPSVKHGQSKQQDDQNQEVLITSYTCSDSNEIKTVPTEVVFSWTCTTDFYSLNAYIAFAAMFPSSSSSLPGRPLRHT